MPPDFQVNLLDVQPSQLFINRGKYDDVERRFQRGEFTADHPFPVMKINGQMVFTDGHTRALVLWAHGISQIRVAWDEDDLDLDTYQVCVRWCEQAGIRRICDLKDRLLDPVAFSQLWIQKCNAVRQHSRNFKVSRFHEGELR